MKPGTHAGASQLNHGFRQHQINIDLKMTCENVIYKMMAIDPGLHDDVIKWKHFPRYWPFVRKIHRSPVNSPHKAQWRGALMFSLICVWINGGVNNREAGDLRRYRAHYGVIVMSKRMDCDWHYLGQKILTGQLNTYLNAIITIPMIMGTCICL